MLQPDEHSWEEHEASVYCDAACLDGLERENRQRLTRIATRGQRLCRRSAESAIVMQSSRLTSYRNEAERQQRSRRCDLGWNRAGEEEEECCFVGGSTIGQQAKHVMTG